MGKTTNHTGRLKMNYFLNKSSIECFTFYNMTLSLNNTENKMYVL